MWKGVQYWQFYSPRAARSRSLTDGTAYRRMFQHHYGHSIACRLRNSSGQGCQLLKRIAAYVSISFCLAPLKTQIATTKNDSQPCECWRWSLVRYAKSRRFTIHTLPIRTLYPLLLLQVRYHNTHTRPLNADDRNDVNFSQYIHFWLTTTCSPEGNNEIFKFIAPPTFTIDLSIANTARDRVT